MTSGAARAPCGILHVSQPERALAEVHRVLVPSGRLAFTTWLAQGTAEDEITAAALAADAIAVEGPEGPSYHVFADFRGYADGEEFALPIAARLISSRASGPAGDGKAGRERQ